MLYKLTKLEFRNKREYSKVTSLLLYDDTDLVGYTHNTGWIEKNLFPENLNPELETTGDFILYYGEVFNGKMKQQHFFSWKKTVSGLYWLSIPSDFEVLSQVKEPVFQLQSKNTGYTLLVDDPIMKKEFEQVVEVEKSKRKVIISTKLPSNYSLSIM